VTFRRGTVVTVDEAGAVAVARIRVSCGDEERAAIASGVVLQLVRLAP